MVPGREGDGCHHRGCVRGSAAEAGSVHCTVLYCTVLYCLYCTGQYTVNTRIPVYKTELYCMVSMVDLIVTPRLRQGSSTATYINITLLLLITTRKCNVCAICLFRRLDMEKLPRILRTHITNKLQVNIAMLMLMLVLFTEIAHS